MADESPLQRSPAATPWRAAHTRRLPGIQPAPDPDWLTVDEAYAGQMALRVRLLDDTAGAVSALSPEAEEAAEELRAHVLALLDRRAGFDLGPAWIVCPDGRRVARDLPPLLALGRLVQEDLCLLVRPEGAAEHVLAGAVLCFPAGWTLAEKMGRPLAAIHTPVAAYDAEVARRVQRLCDGVRPGRPIWRANAHFHDTPTLFAPRREADPKHRPGPDAPYLRVERQTLLRLPRTGAVVFAIHTSVVRSADLSPEDRAALRPQRTL